MKRYFLLIQVNKYPTTIEVMRTCWEKSTNPIFYAFTYFDRGYLRIRRDVIIPRPEEPSVSSFDMDLPDIKARLYFPGTAQELAKATQLIFNIPGGGFVTMHPKNHDDYLSCWARNMKIPIIAIDYGKAPEYPYPWAVEECFDAYRTILETNGACIGLEGWYTTDEKGERKRKDPIKIVMVGDSAMPSEQMELIRIESAQSVGKYVRTKTELDMTAPLQVDEAPRAVNLLTDEVDSTPSWYTKYTPKALIAKKATKIHSGLSMTSRMSYFSDRIIKPELIRAMAIMYLANSPFKPDVLTDYYLSPINAPESILAQFPKTYLLCGEKDPFIDDTARIRDAKRKAKLEWQRLRGRNHDFNDHLTISPRDTSAEMDSHPFSKDPNSMVKVKVLPGMSHAIFQMTSFLPEAKQAVRLTTDWITGMFNEIPSEENPEITSMIISEMNEICEKSVFLRRRNSMASRIGFGKN
ncbi:hypothetical protein HDV01_006526 [Terramyces sp. JEL0728]|nr:hypothetical protein HDV01_006526 [Terramyces sp. JEL0728]